VESAQLYRAFFEEASDALLAVQLPEFRVLHANRAFTALSGLSREELEGEALSVIHHSPPQGYERERQLDTLMLADEGFYNDIALVTRLGELRFVSVRVRHLEIDGRKMALAVLSDDTERQLMLRDLMAKHQSMEAAYLELERVHSQLKATQEKMAQASKLVALGELAAGMSHELNQPLTGIRGFAQEMVDMLQGKDAKPSRKQLVGLGNDIVTNADKMAALLSHLRSFARQEQAQFKAAEKAPASVDLQSVTGQVMKLLDRALDKAGIRVELKSLADCPPVLAQTHPIEQILINLITNSRDAVLARHKGKPGSGRISIEAREDGEHVVLRVSDNGGGVPESVRSRIFNPFFSTKETGQGLGLGLSISYGIAHNFGGELTLESTGPQGSVFALRLPKAPLAAKPRRAA
jgi:PAS domain S-box-containing protein